MCNLSMVVYFHCLWNFFCDHRHFNTVYYCSKYWIRWFEDSNVVDIDSDWIFFIDISYTTTQSILSNIKIHMNAELTLSNMTSRFCCWPFSFPWFFVSPKMIMKFMSWWTIIRFNWTMMKNTCTQLKFVFYCYHQIPYSKRYLISIFLRRTYTNEWNHWRPMTWYPLAMRQLLLHEKNVCDKWKCGRSFIDYFSILYYFHWWQWLCSSVVKNRHTIKLIIWKSIFSITNVLKCDMLKLVDEKYPCSKYIVSKCHCRFLRSMIIGFGLKKAF